MNSTKDALLQKDNVSVYDEQYACLHGITKFLQDLLS